MSIKYHQNGMGNEYGADGRLTDNWNPNIDYGNEYAEVCIRIETNGFDCMNGYFNSDSDRESFYGTAQKILKSFSIYEGCGYDAEHMEKKQAYLYIHPQNINGVVLKNDVRKIAEAFDTSEVCSVRWIDLYHTVYIISDEEYGKYLETCKPKIKEILFDKSATTRRNKYYNSFDIAQWIASVIKKYRLGMGDAQEINYILGCAEEMANDGYLKRYDKDGCMYIRSLNKTEQKEFRKSCNMNIGGLAYETK